MRWLVAGVAVFAAYLALREDPEVTITTGYGPPPRSRPRRRLRIAILE